MVGDGGGDSGGYLCRVTGKFVSFLLGGEDAGGGYLSGEDVRGGRWSTSNEKMLLVYKEEEE